MKKNKLKLGLGMLTVLATPIAVNTVAGTEVHAAQGWVQSGSSWYYYHQGQLVKNAWVGSYWLGADGKMVTNSWVDNGRYYVGTNGVWDKTVKKQVLLKSVENKVPTRGYENGVYYVDSKPANWWYDDGQAWYFFQNGKKLTGYGKDNAGTHYFVNGKYANGKIENKEYRDGKEISAENKVPTRGYSNGVYYVDSKPANWWYDDGQAWYFFQNGKKLTGYGKDNAGTHYFVNGKYANGKIENKEYRDGKEISVENKVLTRGYSNGVYYVDSKLANWWYDDGQAWYFFQNGKKLTGYGKDNAGLHYFVNGKYAKGKIGNKEYRDGKEISVENKVPTRGYANGVYYVDSKPANWWYDDGEAWYFFQNGKKLTGYGKDNAGTHYFVNGKYANGKIGNKEYRDGEEISAENKVPTRGYANGVYYVDSKPANWWYDDGQAWYFFQNGRKFTGYGKDNAGTHYFVNGKYANWWYNDGKDWYFFQNGKKLTGYGKDNAGGHYFENGKYLTDKNTPALNMPQYYQGDWRWAHKRYGLGTMAQSGCVPTSLAMVFNGLGQKVLPTAVADTIYNNTNEMNVSGLGTSGKGAVYAINAYGYKHTVITTREQLIAALQSGKPVFATVGNGIFAKGRLTHAIILSGYSNGKTKAMDPDSSYNTGKWYDINTIWNQRSTDPYDTNIGGSFVAIG